jgi:putative oxidoreductase
MNDFRLKLSLLLLRYGVALVFLMWTIDKLIRPDHAAGVFSHFYLIEGIAPMVLKVLGGLELLLIGLFLLGWKKRFTYGTILILHAISTFSSYRQFLSPFTGTNLLFFASIPMLAAAATLYLLREQDQLLTLRSKGGR